MLENTLTELQVTLRTLARHDIQVTIQNTKGRGWFKISYDFMLINQEWEGSGSIDQYTEEVQTALDVLLNAKWFLRDIEKIQGVK